MASKAVPKGNRVLILTHRTELLSETGGTLHDFGLKPEFIQAGTMYPPQSYNRLIVAMAQTLKNRIDSKKHKEAWRKLFSSFDIVIIDEAHLQDFNDFFYLSVNSFKLFSVSIIFSWI